MTMKETKERRSRSGEGFGRGVEREGGAVEVMVRYGTLDFLWCVFFCLGGCFCRLLAFFCGGFGGCFEQLFVWLFYGCVVVVEARTLLSLPCPG